MNSKYCNVFGLGFLCILVLCAYRFLDFSGYFNIQNRQLVLWGNTFVGLAPCHNVKYGCKFNDRDICCGLLTPMERDEQSISKTPKLRRLSVVNPACNIERKYIPSKYEDEHFKAAEGIGRLQDINARRTAVVNFFRSDIPDSNIWLDRVKHHMKSENTPNITKADWDYLSRFEVTKTCTGGHKYLSKSWVEWIEPLTMHARHPFSYSACPNNLCYNADDKRKMRFPATVQSLDYILIKSGADLHEESTVEAHNHSQLFEPHHNLHAAHRQSHLPSQHFMVDAGTSTFESSMIWFLCAYLQVRFQACLYICTCCDVLCRVFLLPKNWTFLPLVFSGVCCIKIVNCFSLLFFLLAFFLYSER